MFKKMKLQTKLIVTGCFMTALPLIIVSGMVYQQNKYMVRTSVGETTKMMHVELDRIAESVYALADAHHRVEEVTQKNMKYYLNVNRETANSLGGITFQSEKVAWDAVNQLTLAPQKVELPKVAVGNGWLGQTKGFNDQVPLVDHISKLVGVTCTVFQRMNDAGDMLRVATTVKGKDGNRAIGTFIPAVNQDGKTNAVIASVLKGEVYTGRAYVVDRWYITGYEAIMDGSRKVIGMLYVGIPQENLQDLRQAIMSIKVGKSGYVFVLDGKGRYVISKEGKRDGEDISNAKDSSGNLFIQQICQKALNLKPGQIAEQRYSWQNQGEADSRMKVAKIRYFEPWDWVIGVGSYEDELLEKAIEMERTGSSGSMILLGVLGVSLLGAIIIWLFVARGIARPIRHSIEAINEGADQVSSGAVQVASASQSLSQGASEQAASIEETSSSLEEMSSMTKMNAEHADQADVLMKEASQVVGHANDSMKELTRSMEEITTASEQTSKIVKTIDEIAFQTNLLALNAAVEAARAGDAGAGFAVVAGEVRNLALRAADAAKNTADLIEGTVKKVKDGSGLVVRTNEAFGQVADRASKAGSLVAEIAAASKEQSQGIEQVNKAVAEMDRVVQQNAASAEENASASEQMNGQAEKMKAYVNDLIAVVGGGNRQESGRRNPADSKRKKGGEIAADEITAAAPPKVAGSRIVPAKAKEVNPEQVIPLKKDDFKDF